MKIKVRTMALSLTLLVFGWATPLWAQHSHDPVPVQDEHAAVFELVAHHHATHTSVQSGPWGDPETWSNGEVPTEGARVVIEASTEVLLDFVNRIFHKTIRVDGKLRFATDVNTGLKVDTMVVAPSGYLEIGTIGDPVRDGVEAKVIIADDGPVDILWDPMELSRGLISHGRCSMHGQAKTSHANLYESVDRGDTELVLAQVPLNWKAGDVLVLPGNHTRRDFDETLLVTGVVENRVQVVGLGDDGQPIVDWRGLSNRHRLPNGLLPFVINVSRNVVIESENPFHADSYGVNRTRGHVMFMHSGVSKTDTRWVGAYGLGRTDKRTPLESPEFDEMGMRVPDRGHNAVGRYAWHFHRGGPTNAPAIVQGLAIVDSPGLGLVNHGSNVQVSDSSAYNVVGSAFFTEIGNEFGFFRNVAAVRMPGSGQGIEARRHPAGPVQEVDFGHSGHGFWLQGGGVTLHDVKVAGAASAAVIFFTVPLDEPGIGTPRFDSTLLSHPDVAMGRETVPVGVVPLKMSGCYVFGSRQGVETKFHQLQSKHGVPSEIEGVVTVNAGTPLTIPYTHNLVVEDSRFVGSERRAGGRAMRRNSVTRSITFEDLDVRWFYHGLDMPVRGHNLVLNGIYQNVRDINISTTHDGDRLIEILGSVQFPDLSEAQRTYKRKGVWQVDRRYQIHLRTNFSPKHNDITKLFERDLIRLGTILYQDKQLFYHAQAADFVPFPSELAADYVPAQLIDKTNAELWAEYGLAIGDAIAPSDAVVDPLIHALIGDPIEYSPKIRIRSRKYTNLLDNYRLVHDVWLSDGSRLRRRLPEMNLAEGWNLFTFEEESQLRTLLVFGDITPPEFVLSTSVPTVINPLDLKRGFRVTGTILDNSFGSKHFKKVFKGYELLALPIFTREDGSSYVVLEFTVRDFAGNTTPVSFELTLDEAEPLFHVKQRVVNPPRVVVSALMYLLGFGDES